MNAAAEWHGLLITGGCDEGCSAYIFAELVDAVSGKALAGFTRENFQVMTD